MNYSIRFLQSILYFSIVAVHGYPLSNDQEALVYCLNHTNSFIAIVWPIAQGKEALITGIMNLYGTILYRKEYYFTPKKALHILRKAHANVHIPTSMKEHVKWYFPPHTYEQPGRIFVIRFSDMSQNLSCKYAIRRLYPDLHYRSIHINDYHSEAIELAKLFFN